MKQTDISVGEVYELAQNHGKDGISLRGVKIRVTEKNVGKTKQRGVGVNAVVVDDEGNPLVNATTGEPITRFLLAREIVSCEQANEMRAAQEAENNERTRRYMVARKLQTELEELVISVLGFDGANVDTYFDVDADEARVRYVRFYNERDPLSPQIADKLVAALRSFEERKLKA